MTSLAAAPAGLERRAIATVKHVVALPRGHRLAHKRRLKLADLTGEAAILPPVGRPHREAVCGALASVGGEFGPIVEANGWPLILHFVRLGLGLAVVNGCCRAPAGVLVRPLSGMAPLSYVALRRRATPTRSAGGGRETGADALWRLLGERVRFARV